MKYLCSILFLFFCNKASTQSLSVNTDGSTANASALLDVKSTTKGLLLPRMTKAQKNAIAIPASGLLVYQNSPDSVGFQYFDGTKWLWLQGDEDTYWAKVGNDIFNRNLDKVGVGTSTPLARLHVTKGFAGNPLTIPANRISLFEDDASNYIQLVSPDANETGILAGNASTLIKSGIVFAADSAVLIRTGGNNTRIFAAKTGLVGIGNTNPQSRLHVSNGNTSGALYATPSTVIFENSGFNFLQLMNPSAASATIMSGTELTTSRSSINFNPDSSIVFNSPGFANRMSVKNTGEVLVPGLLGVGTTVPQTKFHVSRGTVAGAAYNTTSTGIFESSGFNFLQLMNPSAASATIMSGTELTTSRSSINFNPDSSIVFNSPGFANRMSVKNTGEVLVPGLLGVGTTVPQTKFHVSRGTVAGAAYNTTSTGIFESSGFNFLQLMNPSAASATIMSGTELTTSRSSINFNPDSSIVFNSPGFANRMSVKNTGEVLVPGLLGVGTTLPQTKFHVSRGTVAGAAYNTISTGIFESSGFNFLQLMNPSAASATIMSGTELTTNRSSINFNPDSSIVFNSPGFANRMSVKNTGEVLVPGLLGVGTTVPQTKFHVSRGTVAGAAYNTTSTGIFESSGFNFLQLMNPSAASATIISGTELTNNRSSINFNADSSLSFAAGGFFTRMTILKNGNTGINTANPAATLDANGTFKLGILGTVNSAIIKNVVTIDVGSVAANNELDVVTAVAGVSTVGAVSVSPAINLPAGIIIAWARVSSPGNITIRYRNVTGSAIDPPSISYIIAVIQ